ncbi:DUF222 domain-containing protein [Mycolicibacterium fortuitum]|uniref:DUF222 domain-containing protein n=1 Tax=Mycolicibacterium fortuitum TaxID=1766 RepID=UPI000AFB9F17|nr:DUF222 domain-containing protein [Mycolicibacterium fortuitum]
MSVVTASFAAGVSPVGRLEVLFDEVAELVGQRNAIDGRLVEIVAELDRDELCGATGARSIAALVAWKTGIAPRNAETVVAVARRLEQFPRCAQGMCEGRLSLDQVGVIAEHAADGSDEHYAELAASATVRQLRTAVKLEPRPEPETRPEPERFISRTEADEHITWRIRLPRLDAAKLDTALQTHHDALVTDWRRDHDINGEGEQAPPFPDLVDAFMSLIEAGWDTEAARRPHGLHTTVAVHLNLTDRIAALHLGPVLTEDDRRYLLCDATCEAWFERQGQPVGVGRATRTISRRLRRALEHRDHCCVVPGCGATRWGFGYEPDKLTIRESEAAVVRELMARVIAGENVHELTMWLNTTQVPTVRGGPWSTTALRGILSSPRIAGLRAYRGEVIGPGI